MVKSAMWKVMGPIVGVAGVGLSLFLVFITPNTTFGLLITALVMGVTLFLKPPFFKTTMVVLAIGLVIKVLLVSKQKMAIEKKVDKKVKKEVEKMEGEIMADAKDIREEAQPTRTPHNTKGGVPLSWEDSHK